MKDNDTKRLSRLTAILIQLQTKRLVTATSLAKKFCVSIRTIYRDIKALEKAGVPILLEEGKGYSLMEGYKIPPIMFSETEANALITLEQLVVKNSDRSLVKEYTAAIDKIKAVLPYSTKQKTELLSDRITVSHFIRQTAKSNSLSLIQQALTAFIVLKISYRSGQKGEITERQIEPFALYYSLQESWIAIAYCRMRKDYRMFRLDRIVKIEILQEQFTPHKLSLGDYLSAKEKMFITPDTPLS